MHTHTYEPSVWSLVKDYGGTPGKPMRDPNIIQKPADKCCVELPHNLKTYFQVVPGIRIPCTQKQIEMSAKSANVPNLRLRKKDYIEHQQHVLLKGGQYDILKPAKGVEWSSKIVHNEQYYWYRILFVRVHDGLKGKTLHELQTMVPCLDQSGAALIATLALADCFDEQIVISGCQQSHAGAEYLMTPTVKGVKFSHVRYNREIGTDLLALCELVSA